MVMRKRKKRKGVTVYEAAVKCKYQPGQRVIGRRSPNEQSGEFVRSYVTVNINRGSEYHNVAYVIKCDSDGKERVFQCLKAVV